MTLNPDKVLEWVEKHFDDIKVKGNEIKVNSIFCDDRKRHLWINPEGGKKHRPYGVYRCWKTDNKGSIVKLVMLVEKCSFEEALEILEAADISLVNLEKQVEAIFYPEEDLPKPTAIEGIALPPGTQFIDDMSPDNPMKLMAEIYLLKRKLPTKNLAACDRGDDKDRIIIPYFDREGKLIYYNGRSIGRSKLRYKGPDISIGVGKEDVVFIPEWPELGSEINVAEGEFNALSIYYSGKATNIPMYSAACGGKSISEKQIEYLRPYKINLCLDTDKAGKEALKKMFYDFRRKGISCHYVRPPEKFNDWNNMLIHLNEKLLVYYILRNRKPLDEIAMTILS